MFADCAICCHSYVYGQLVISVMLVENTLFDGQWRVSSTTWTATRARKCSFHFYSAGVVQRSHAATAAAAAAAAADVAVYIQFED